MTSMSSHKRLVLQSGNVFDSLTGKVKKNQTVVIKDKHIIWIGKEESFEKEKGDKIINIADKMLLPGLIECHIHLDFTGNPQSEREFARTKTAMWGYIGLYHAQKHLVSGFTCVRDCGAHPDWSPALKRIINNGILAGPRLVVCDRFFGQFGNNEYVAPDMFKRFQREVYEVPSGPNGVTHAVRERRFHGSDFIKTATTGGVLHGIESKLEMSFWTDEELDAIVKEAHRLGMHVACHAHGREGIYRAVKANIDTIEHGSFLDEEIADLMVKKGTFLIPTQSALTNLIHPKIISQMPLEVQKKTKETANQAIQNHKIAYKKGVRIAIGTDAGTPGNYHGTSGCEIRSMVDNVGMSPNEALQAATIKGAKAIGLDEKIGSIEVGKYADLVVCNKDPIKDISVIEQPKNFSHIIRDGFIMVENGKISYFK